MKVIGILTENFSVYYDLIRLLKEKNIPFESLCFGKKIPAHVGAIITTKEEEEKVKFKSKVYAEDDIEKAVQSAQKLLAEKKTYYDLIIGIDPGERPGIAVICDGTPIQTMHAKNPEEVKKLVEKILLEFPAHRKTIKIGHGAKILRNRTINALIKLKSKAPIEIVDETKTTDAYHDKDIYAAVKISFLNKGVPVVSALDIKPTKGDLRYIQRRSRIESKTLTISQKLAEEVAKGKISLKSAIRKQKILK